MEKQLSKKRVIITRVREILGKDQQHLTDEQIQKVLDFMYDWAKMEYDQFIRTQNSKSGE